MPTDARHRAIESGFRRSTMWVLRWRGVVIVVGLVVSAVMIAGLGRLRTEFSDESYLLREDRARQVYDTFRARFGRESVLLVALQPQRVLDLDFLATLRVMHEAIEDEVPHVAEVTSLVDARDTRGIGDELVVGELLEDWPENDADLAAVGERIRRNRVYRGTLVSPDLAYAAIAVELETYSSTSAEDPDVLGGFESDAPSGQPAPAYLTKEETAEALASLRDVLARFDGGPVAIDLVGGEVVGHRIESIANSDARLYSVVSIGLVMVLLGLLFGRVSAVLLPLAVVQLSMLSTFGLMGWLDLAYTPVSQALITFLVAVGICDAVHVLTMVDRSLELGLGRDEAIVEAMAHSGIAVVLTSLTTAGGLASFLAAEISPVADLGVVAPLGVLIALVYALVLLPAVLSLSPIERRRRTPTTGANLGAGLALLRRGLVSCGRIATTWPRGVLVVAAVVTLVAGLGVERVRFSQDNLEWLFEDDPVRRSVRRVDAAFGGVQTLEIVVDTGRDDGLYDPDVLHAMQRLLADVEAIGSGPVRVVTTRSILDILRETNRALHANDDAHYAIPADRALIAQELLLFENSGSDDLEDWTDSRLRTARLSLQVTWTDGRHYVDFLERLKQAIDTHLPASVDVDVTGSVALSSRAFSLLLVSMTRSYVVALVVITPLMALLLGSVRRGLLAMIPNLLPVWMTLGLAGALDLPFNMSTLLTGSIVIGVAVDDTIHLMHRCDREIARGADAAEAVRRALESTGPALLVTTLVLTGSFLVYTLGHFNGMVHFGVLAAFATAIAFLADLFVAPALLVLTTPPGVAVDAAGRLGPR